MRLNRVQSRRMARMDGRQARRGVLGALMVVGWILGVPLAAGEIVGSREDPSLTLLESRAGDPRLTQEVGVTPECPQSACMDARTFCPTDPDCCGGIDCIKVPTSLAVFYRFNLSGAWKIEAPTPGACGLKRKQFWVKCGPPLLNATCG